MLVLDIIRDLPTDINVALFCTWIDAPDLTRFDSALCSKQTRDSFLLKMFTEKSFKIRGCDHTVKYRGLDLTSSPFNDWVYLRQLKYQKVFLVGNDEIVRCSEKSSDLSVVNVLEIMAMNPLVCECESESCVVLINSCLSLDRLVLFHLKITNSVLERINGIILRRLKQLYVHNLPCCPLSVQFGAHIAAMCSALVYLDLTDHSCGSKEVVNQFNMILKSNPLLLCVHLVNHQIDDSVLSTVQLYCLRVRHLWFAGIHITIGAVVALQSARADTLVDFNVQIYDKALSAIRFSHPLSLDGERVVRVKELCGLSPSIMRGIVHQRYPITQLVLKSIVLTSDMLETLAKCNPQLRLLAVDACGKLFTKSAMKLFIVACRDTLTHLHLGDCDHFTPDGLVELVGVVGEKLRVMCITGYNQITYTEMSKMISLCFNLQHMYVCCFNTLGMRYWDLYKYLCCDDPKSCRCVRSIPNIHTQFNDKLFDRIVDNGFVNDCF